MHPDADKCKHLEIRFRPRKAMCDYYCPKLHKNIDYGKCFTCQYLEGKEIIETINKKEFNKRVKIEWCSNCIPELIRLYHKPKPSYYQDCWICDGNGIKIRVDGIKARKFNHKENKDGTTTIEYQLNV